jgi:hypothetical protein
MPNQPFQRTAKGGAFCRPLNSHVGRLLPVTLLLNSVGKRED